MNYKFPGYMAEIICSGKCPVLVPASSFRKDGNPIIKWDMSGLVSLKELLHMLEENSSKKDALNLISSAESSIMDSYAAVLKLIRIAAENLSKAGDWLIKPEYISMDVNDIYWDPGLKTVRFIAGKPSGISNAGCIFTDLCRCISECSPKLNTDLILENFEREVSMDNPDLKGIIRLIYGWELEILK